MAVERRWAERAERTLRSLSARVRVRSYEAVHSALSSALVPCSTRSRALGALFGFEVHGRLSALVRLLGTARLTIGHGSFINSEVLLDLSEEIHIGSGVHIGPRACIYTSSHEVGDAERRAGEVIRAPVSIGDGCWIGANAIVLPGVVLGKGIVIAAGAVVTKSLSQPGVYAGAPARLVRGLDETADRSTPAAVRQLKRAHRDERAEGTR